MSIRSARRSRLRSTTGGIVAERGAANPSCGCRRSRFAMAIESLPGAGRGLAGLVTSGERRVASVVNCASAAGGGTWPKGRFTIPVNAMTHPNRASSRTTYAIRSTTRPKRRCRRCTGDSSRVGAPAGPADESFVRGRRGAGFTLRSRRRRRHEKPTCRPTLRAEAWVAWVGIVSLEWTRPTNVGIAAGRGARGEA
jgi:hypothetical protein